MLVPGTVPVLNPDFVYLSGTRYTKNAKVWRITAVYLVCVDYNSTRTY